MKRFLSVIMSLAMCISTLPSPALAVEPPETVKNLCEHTGDYGDPCHICPAQAMIDALPSVEKVNDMSLEGQREAYDRLQAAYDAYEALSGEEQNQIVGAGILKELSRWFNGQIIPTAGEVASGSFSYDLHWVLYDNGSLTITGTGYMPNDGGWIDYKDEIQKVEVGEGVTSIGHMAFYECANLTEIVLPDSVTSIDSYAFYGCTSLVLTELPDSITSIGNSAFYKCTNLALTKLPDSLTSIGAGTFIDCSNLVLKELPAGVTSIGAGAFSGCTSLALTKLPDSVTSIGNSTFNGCTSLVLTKLPSGITSIGEWAFGGCTNLALKELPADATSIGMWAFNGCTGLTDLTFVSDTPPTLGIGVFRGCPDLTIHIPDNDIYTANWPMDIISMIAHNISVQNNGNGTASASLASSKSGRKIDLTATPDSGYHFKEWQVISGGVTISGDSFIMPAANVTVKAVFEQDSPTPPVTYTVTVQNDGNGTASASSTSVAAGTEITLTATPNGGYHFKEWQVISGSVTISNNSFTMPAENVTVKAVFEQDGPTPPVTYTVTVQNDGNGTASASSTSAEAGVEITLTATPNGGYHFKEWQVVSGGVTISNNRFTLPTANVTVKAIFEKNNDPTPPQPAKYSVMVQTGTGGTASASRTSATAGTKITLTATPDSGYHFKEWQVISGGVTISGDSFIMPAANVTVKAVFEQDSPTPPVTYTVTVQTDGNGTASASPISAAAGSKIALSATPKDGYHFTEWQIISGGVTISGNSFTMPSRNVIVKAIFEQDAPAPPTVYAVTVQNDGNGTASASPISATAGTEITLTATPKDGYHFKEWQVISGGVTISSDNFTMPAANVVIKAIFEQDSPTPPTTYTVTVNNSYATPSGAGSYEEGATVFIHAGRRSNYRFNGWTSQDGILFASAGSADTNFTMLDKSVTVTANWTYIGGGPSGGSYAPPTYPPIVERPDKGGGVTVSPSKPRRGDTVTIRPNPDQGYEVDQITVTDRNGKAVTVTAKPDGTYTFTQPTGKVKIEVTYQPMSVEIPWNSPFTDIAKGDWCYEAVRFVHERGLMNGYSDGRFAPNDNLSRAQLAQILFNKEGRPTVNYLMNFSDVTGEAWYAEAIRWAASQGIVGGYDNGMFGPNDPITREQLAVMLWRYSGSPAATHKELNFNDTDEISGFALEALRWAVENGIINGKGNGILDPKGLATRAQVAQMLKNYLER